MRIIISPAKKMNVDRDTLQCQGLPIYLEKAKDIMDWMKCLTLEEAKALWGCNNKLAQLNYSRFQSMNLRLCLTPALLSYEGIQYQYMAPNVFTQEAWDYVQKNLRVLSGFYGVLRPLDGVVPYRLEMQAKARPKGADSLYDYWGDKLYQAVLDESRVIINLASKEYAKCIEKYVVSEDTWITCVFGEMQDGKVKQKGTQAKMARGEMVRFMAENRIEKPKGLKEFQGLGYRYQEELSSESEYVFVKQRNGGR